MLEELERLRGEIEKVKAAIYGGHAKYAAARATLRQAIVDIQGDKIKEANKRIREAQALVERENNLWHKLESIEEMKKFKEGYTAIIANQAVELIRAGEIEQAERLVQELSRTVEEENKAYKKVMGAEQLIGQKLAGANIEEAKALVSESIEALKRGEYDRAGELAEKAKLAAKPTTEYLLTSAKELAGRALEAFEAENYEEAIRLWERSTTEYSRAGEVAEERDEQEVVERVKGVIAALRENITKAEVAIDNREMVAMVEQANRLVEEAEERYSKGDYQVAKERYEGAKAKFFEAKKLAERRGFAEKEEIEKAITSVEESIESCLLSKGRTLLDRAAEILREGRGEEAEKAFEESMHYLGSLEVRDEEERDAMLAEARRGIVDAKISQARQRMEEAERVFSAGEYYKAKEMYREVRDYLGPVMDEAASYGLQEHVKEIDSLIGTCQGNITSATIAMTAVEGVEVEIRRVDGIARARARFAARVVDKNREELGRLYREVEYIGGGGFADVYRCITKEGAVVAVKVPRNIDESAERVFFNEVSKWQGLSHRNIIRLIKPKLRPPCIEMEFADGGSLYELLRRTGRLDEARACEIVYDVARALEYSHSKGIWHTDVNPKNILLTSTGEAKLTDFGLAKIATSSSGVKGFTLPYSAPEQLKERKADERTDVYQLGLTLYVMLSGENPFDAGTEEETEERVKSIVPEKIAGVDEELNELVLRCLAKKPRDRPSAREFRKHIYTFVKRKYKVSLHLTKDWRKECEIVLKNAIYAAKECDYAGCLSSLDRLKTKVHDAELREEVRGLHKNVEYRLKKGLPLEPLIDSMEYLRRRL
jgi:serine/threonine protein kinase